MPNRKKRLRRGIESIDKQITLHEEKKKKTKEEGNIELEQYYGKEIGNLEETREKKKDLLDKQ